MSETEYPNLDEPSFEMRVEEAVKWVNDASLVADRSGLTEPVASIKWLTERFALGTINNDISRKRPMEGYSLQAEDLIALNPLYSADVLSLQGDTPVQKTVIDMASGKSGDLGLYIRNAQTILFHQGGYSTSMPKGLTPFSRGLTLLHELRHAKLHLLDELEYDRWNEEAAVTCYEFDILEAIGGRKYTKLAERVKAETGLYRDGGRTRVRIGGAKDSYAESVINALAGKQVSNPEFKHLQNTIRKNGFWLFCQENSDNPINKFADFLSTQSTAKKLNSTS